MSDQVLKKLQRYAINCHKPNYFLFFKSLFEKEILPLQDQPNFKEITHKILTNSTNNWNQSDAFLFLLQKNYADPNFVDNEGKTPLVHVCLNPKFPFQYRQWYAKALLNYGANPRFVFKGQEVFGYMLRLFGCSIFTTLSTSTHNYELISYYLDQGCSGNYRYKFSSRVFSPYYDFYSLPKCLKILLLHGAIITYEDKVNVAQELINKISYLDKSSYLDNKDPVDKHWPYLMFMYCVLKKNIPISHIFYAHFFLTEGDIILNTVSRRNYLKVKESQSKWL